MVQHHLQHLLRDEVNNLRSDLLIRHRPALAWVSLLLFVIFVFGNTGCRQDDQRAQKQGEKFSVATLPWPGSAPIYVGIDKGYFKDEGLDLNLKPVPTGKIGLEALLSGQVQSAGAADTPISRFVVNGERIVVIATIAELQRAIMIIAKKDSGIAGPGDLKGKTIGVTRGAGAEFFLHIYLVANNITPTEVRIVNIEPDKIVDALLKGEVEAVSTWSPYKLVLFEKLGNSAVALSDPALYLQTFNIATTPDYAKNNPESLKKFLRGVLHANDFIKENPEETQAIMSKYVGAESTLYQREWSNYNFTAVLNQSLILNLEDQARWMLQQAADPPHKAPDFMEYIDAGPLKAVQPQAIRIIGE